MMYRPTFYVSNNPLEIVIHQLTQITQASNLIFKMAANSIFSSYIFAYRVDLWCAMHPKSTLEPQIVVPFCSEDPHH
jgi:hypothetical protein